MHSKRVAFARPLCGCTRMRSNYECIVTRMHMYAQRVGMHQSCMHDECSRMRHTANQARCMHSECTNVKNSHQFWAETPPHPIAAANPRDCNHERARNALHGEARPRACRPRRRVKLCPKSRVLSCLCNRGWHGTGVVKHATVPTVEALLSRTGTSSRSRA